MILKFIEQGTTIIDGKVEYFKDVVGNSSAYSYKSEFINLVKSTFSISH
jgi:hypothetical protein